MNAAVSPPERGPVRGVEHPAILIVDDEVNIRSALKRSLSRHNIKVHAADCPEAGRALLQTVPQDQHQLRLSNR